ncbi:hypothetical protein LZ32DRAFT_181903 [Colletotrichum eremochloae]|nr:hypothetical protein LZ32DRAFT_181903 [Colletotrichum eremochloae]
MGTHERCTYLPYPHTVPDYLSPAIEAGVAAVRLHLPLHSTLSPPSTFSSSFSYPFPSTSPPPPPSCFTYSTSFSQRPLEPTLQGSPSLGSPPRLKTFKEISSNIEPNSCADKTNSLGHTSPTQSPFRNDREQGIALTGPCTPPTCIFGGPFILGGYHVQRPSFSKVSLLCETLVAHQHNETAPSHYVSF